MCSGSPHDSFAIGPRGRFTLSTARLKSGNKVENSRDMKAAGTKMLIYGKDS